MVLWSKIFPEAEEGIQLEDIDTEKVLELFIQREHRLQEKSPEIYEMYAKMMVALENIPQTQMDLIIVIDPFMMNEKSCGDNVRMNKAAAFTALTLLKSAAPESNVEIFAFNDSTPDRIDELNFNSISAAIKPSSSPTNTESISKLIEQYPAHTVVVMGYSTETNHAELMKNEKISKLVMCNFGGAAAEQSVTGDLLIVFGFDKSLCKRIMSFAS